MYHEFRFSHHCKAFLFGEYLSSLLTFLREITDSSHKSITLGAIRAKGEVFLFLAGRRYQYINGEMNFF